MASPSSAALPRFPALTAWLRHFLRPARPERLHPFDIRHGVDTDGLLYADGLATGHAHDRFNEGYYATAPSLFQGALERWRQTIGNRIVNDYAFIDLGCGKGRALLLASELPFRAVRGIELHPRLARIARRNARRWRNAHRPHVGAPALDFETRGKRITIETADVLDYDWDHELTAGPLVLFLFNSFAAELLAALLARLAASRINSSIELIYVHPEHDALLAGTPGIERLCSVEVMLTDEDAAADAFSVASDTATIYRMDKNIAP